MFNKKREKNCPNQEVISCIIFYTPSFISVEFLLLDINQECPSFAFSADKEAVQILIKGRNRGGNKVLILIVFFRF